MLGFKRDPEYIAEHGIDLAELHDHVLNVYGEDLQEGILINLKIDIDHAAEGRVTWDGVDLPDYLAAYCYYCELDNLMDEIDSIGDALW